MFLTKVQIWYTGKINKKNTSCGSATLEIILTRHEDWEVVISAAYEGRLATLTWLAALCVRRVGRGLICWQTCAIRCLQTFKRMITRSVRITRYSSLLVLQRIPSFFLIIIFILLILDKICVNISYSFNDTDLSLHAILKHPVKCSVLTYIESDRLTTGWPIPLTSISQELIVIETSNLKCI